jgi:hypothetical protein
MSVFAVFLDVVLAALVLLRQRRVRPVPLRLRLGFPMVLAVLGMIQLVDYTAHRHLPAGAVGVLLASLVIGAGLLGAARAASVRLWPQPPFVLRQGTPVTMVLWLVSFALHFAAGWGITAAGGPSGLAAASFLLYLGITYGVQTAIAHRRAEPIRSAMGPAANTAMGPGFRLWFGGVPGPAGYRGAPGYDSTPRYGGEPYRNAAHPVIDAESEALPRSGERDERSG